LRLTTPAMSASTAIAIRNMLTGSVPGMVGPLPVFGSDRAVISVTVAFAEPLFELAPVVAVSKGVTELVGPNVVMATTVWDGVSVAEGVTIDVVPTVGVVVGVRVPMGVRVAVTVSVPAAVPVGVCVAMLVAVDVAGLVGVWVVVPVGVTVNVACLLVSPRVPVIVTTVEVVTGTVAIGKVVLVCPAGTNTLVGTVAAGLLLLSMTVTPPTGAGPVKVTVPVDDVPPDTDGGFTVTVKSVTPGVAVLVGGFVAPTVTLAVGAVVGEVVGTAVVVAVLIGVVVTLAVAVTVVVGEVVGEVVGTLVVVAEEVGIAVLVAVPVGTAVMVTVGVV